MARIYTTAAGHQVDIDAIIIKQQLAEAPMTIDVETRKTFIDSKEVRKRPEEITGEVIIEDSIIEEAPKLKTKK